MSTYNHATLLGRLTRDPELKDSGDKPYARFSIAVNRPGPRDRDQKTDFFDGIVFGRQAETFAEYCHKGDEVLVAGSVEIDDYETKEGEKRKSVKIKAQTWQKTRT